MITAIDTNILLDVLAPQTRFAAESAAAVKDAYASGSLVISEPVYAELAVGIPTRQDLTQFLLETGIRVEPSTPVSLHLAGTTWREYLTRRQAALMCSQCGTVNEIRCSNCQSAIRSRQHLIADFMIGAHASIQADALLTRDRGMYTSYFPKLRLV